MTAVTVAGVLVAVALVALGVGFWRGRTQDPYRGLGRVDGQRDHHQTRED